MKTLKKISLILLIAGLMTGIQSCKKYEDGPGLTFKSAEKRLQRTWMLDTYLRNGNDATAELLINNYQESYSENGVYTRSYIDKDSEAFAETGDWEFTVENEKIRLMGVSSIELTDNNSTVSAADITILRLTSKDLWYYFENGGDLHEFRLTSP